MITVLIALLHLGNVRFEADSNGAAGMFQSSLARLNIACDLLGVDNEALHVLLVQHKRRGTARTKEEATIMRDSIMFLIYSTVFKVCCVLLCPNL